VVATSVQGAGVGDVIGASRDRAQELGVPAAMLEGG
jgi:hypothetical protein